MESPSLPPTSLDRRRIGCSWSSLPLVCAFFVEGARRLSLRNARFPSFWLGKKGLVGSVEPLCFLEEAVLAFFCLPSPCFLFFFPFTFFFLFAVVFRSFKSTSVTPWSRFVPSLFVFDSPQSFSFLSFYPYSKSTTPTET